MSRAHPAELELAEPRSPSRELWGTRYDPGKTYPDNINICPIKKCGVKISYVVDNALQVLSGLIQL